MSVSSSRDPRLPGLRRAGRDRLRANDRADLVARFETFDAPRLHAADPGHLGVVAPSSSTPTIVAGNRLAGTDELRDELRHRPLIHLLGSAELLDPSVSHDRHAVGHEERLLLVVGHVHERDPDLVLDPLELKLQRLAELQVQRSERLVEQQHLGIEHQRPSERHPLLLAAAELRGAVPSRPCNPTSSSISATAPVSLRLRGAALSQSERDVLEHGQVWEQCVLLKDRVDRPACAARTSVTSRPCTSIRPSLGSHETRRSSAASSSCHSRSGRSARRTRHRRSRGRRRRPRDLAVAAAQPDEPHGRRARAGVPHGIGGPRTPFWRSRSLAPPVSRARGTVRLRSAAGP